MLVSFYSFATDPQAINSLSIEAQSALMLDSVYKYAVGFRDIDRISVETKQQTAESKVIKFRPCDKQPEVVAEFTGDFYARLTPGDYILMSSQPIVKAEKH